TADCDGDGVINEKEKEDGTDPLDPCDLIYTSITILPSYSWKKSDCDGDGVTNWQEVQDKTDPTDPCDYLVTSVTLPQSGAFLTADCDGDGVINEKEKEDGTDPLDPCDLIYTSITILPSYSWKKGDCDGDGVTNWQEVQDKTDPTDPCDYLVTSVTLPQSGAFLTADCDGDGVINEKEKEDGTDPLDPCEFVLEHQTVPTTSEWNALDCDGDGVTNEDEKEDGTDPLDPCSYDPESVSLPQSGAFLTADCDGDGVINEKEKEDGTDPLDPCEFVLEHQTVPTTSEWNALDCDGDGVTNEDEKEDGTDPLDPCSYDPESVSLPQSGAYLTADCDGDGVTNEKEKEDGTDPLDPCEFVLEHQTVPTTSEWNALDCDGDGVTNEDEKEDGTDPLDPCSYDPASITLSPSKEWEGLDCDDDGNPNGTDPDPLVATARDDSDSTPALTEVAINILENDDYLPNNDPNNVGTTSLSQIGGTAIGSVTLDALTGMLTYIPTVLESNTTVTIIYEVCNVDPDPSVCASAIVSIQVEANTLDAVDDDFNGNTTGGTIPDSNVLSNDTLNGVTVLPEEVTITSTPTNELTINEDGSISISLGTAEGTYAIGYTICEVANPTNCDSATVTISVGPGSGNTLDAVDDDYSGSTTGGTIPDSNVLSNDTLNGVTVLPEEVTLTSTSTDQLTINEDGSISVSPGTAEGTYTIDYTICEVVNPTNCDSATVTISVGPGSGNTLDAVDDNYSGSTSGGTIPDSNVLSNDTLNGVTVLPEEITITSTPTDELTINEDGSISVSPGTAEGTYTIGYTICEVANPSNCDSATVTVEVVKVNEDEKIEVNQLVTPNADGKNDFLFIRGVRNAKNNSLQIYNRWGVAVYKGSGYNNQNNVFDGRSKGRSTVTGSDYLPAGVYYYIFQYENNQRNITDSGYIYLSQ
ncbi:gliding motility-associated C-terminal domain-containing protein, partial [Arenibacter antarcticus]